MSDNITTQLHIEYGLSKYHTVETIRKMMPALDEHVNAYIDSVIAYYNQEHSFVYEVKGEVRTWHTKQERYEQIRDMDVSGIAWDTVIACITKPSVTFTEVVGKLYKKFNHATDRQGMESASEFIALLSKTPFIKVVYPAQSNTGTLNIVSKVKLTDEVTTYLSKQMHILPSLVPLQPIRTNEDSGYLSFKQSVVLNDSHHELPQNLSHLNRANSVALTLNPDVLLNTSPSFKEEPNEPKDTRALRYKQWLKLNTESVHACSLFSNKEFYLTHAYCERGRTYAKGHQIDTQGDSYRKCAIEFANKELVEM